MRLRQTDLTYRQLNMFTNLRITLQRPPRLLTFLLALAQGGTGHRKRAHENNAALLEERLHGPFADNSDERE
jgi:hypothetical protein